MKTVLEILTLTSQFLKQKGIAHPRRQAEELLGEALGIGRMGLYLEHERPLTEAELDKCRSWLKRRALGEPLAYIAGSVEFFGCRIKVGREALIPRQETEILADKIAAALKAMPLDGKVLWDLCCGTGCLGISLKKRFPQLAVTLSDVSPEALALARDNAAFNGADVGFLQGDLLTPFAGGKADFVVCNPPYVAEHEYDALEPDVRAFEPKVALVGGKEGTEFYARLAADLPNDLNPGARVWLEIGDGQGKRVEALFGEPCWTRRVCERDWSGRERFFSLEFE